jgi:hypothetical protein
VSGEAALLREFDACAAALAAPGQPGAIHAAVEASLGRLVGHRLFTLLVVDGDEVARIHSSNPAAYPVSGRKPMNRTPWGDVVLRDRKTWVAKGPDDIRWAFFDHALIFSLGLGACINVPVAWDGRTIGTMNLLDAAGRYRDEHGALAARFAPFLVAPFLAAARLR